MDPTKCPECRMTVQCKLGCSRRHIPGNGLEHALVLAKVYGSKSPQVEKALARWLNAPEPRPTEFFASLPTGTVVELRESAVDPTFKRGVHAETGATASLTIRR